jgi:CHAT domain-containing protein
LAPRSANLAACERQFAAHPDAPESARCFWLDKCTNEEAARRVRKLLVLHPESAGLQLAAAVLEPAPRERSERRIRSAADKFSSIDRAGEALARYILVDILLDQHRLDEAGREVERETTAARQADARRRARYLALAQVSRANLLFRSGDLEKASLLLDEVPAGPLREEKWLRTANTVHTETGQTDRSWDECLQLAQPTFSWYARAAGLYCQARVIIERTAELPNEPNRKLLSELARKAIGEAEAGCNWGTAVRSHWLLAMVSQRGEAARAELVRCLESAHGAPERSICLGALARYQATMGKAPARELAEQAAGLSFAGAISRAQGAGDRMRVSYATRSFDDFTGDAQRALSEIESLRDRQSASDIQMGLFSGWSDDYYYFAGRLLQKARDGRCPLCLDRAFAVVERLRARGLEEKLVATRAAISATRRDEARLAELREAIERVARRRQDGALPRGERQNAENDLAAFTAEEQRLRQRAGSSGSSRAAGSSGSAGASSSAGPLGSAGSDGDAGPARTPDPFVTLARVQKLLAADEALLSFQIAPWQDWTGDFGGGSWLIAVTKTGRRSYALREMGRGDLRGAVADLVEHRFRPENWQVAELYRQLLGPALAELPAGVERLTIVPDDHLHRLPFAALRATPDSRPLAWRYQLSIVPSATLWANWHSARRQVPAERPALVLADPPPPTAAVQRAFRAGGIVLPAEPLPAARREADALARFLGWGCERHVGSEASAAVLLRPPTEVARFALVHFAAHSIVDDRDPRRSGIWLSPSPGRDGLLRAAEIARLNFNDRLVVLSTCSSNGGPFLRGEGVLSLAHAFFQARARTVVASLWPQVDTDAEALLTGFYRHLGRGASVAAALRQAQLDRLRQEPRLPPAAWAGMVVLGDGDLVPFPGGRHPGPPPSLIAAGLAAAAAILALVAALVAVVRRNSIARRRRPV